MLAARGTASTPRRGAARRFDYLFANVARVREEAASWPRSSRRSARAPDATAGSPSARASSATRGLAGGFLGADAVRGGSRRLRARRARRAARGSVNRVAIVGPGLDFADKQEGFDFYQPQSLQPFTSPTVCFRCGLATRARSRSRPRHQPASQRASARRGAARDERRTAYRLVLPWNPGGADQDAAAYWKRSGRPSGRRSRAAAPPSAGRPRARRRGVAGTSCACGRSTPASFRSAGAAGASVRSGPRDQRPPLLRHVRADAGARRSRPCCGPGASC